MCLLLLDLIKVFQELVKVVHPINDEVSLLLKVLTLIREELLVLQKVLHLLKLLEDVLDARVALMCHIHKVLQHLRLLVKVLSLLTVEVCQVHVLDSKVPFQLTDAFFHQFQVFGFYLEWSLVVLGLEHGLSLP